MTLAYGSEPTKIVLTLRDESQNKATKTFIVPTSAWDPDGAGTVAEIEAIRDALVVQVNLVTDALIWKATIHLGQAEDTATQGAANSEIENIASVVVNLATLGKTGVIQIPAPVIGLFVAASGKNKNVIDTADVDLNTFIDMFQTTGGDFVISDGEFVDDTTPIDAGKRIHRKSRRG